MMTDDELLSAIESAESQALGPMTSEIASDRAEALNRYRGKPYGDEQVGRSQVVSRDVQDVVEGVAANVLKPFVSGDEVVKFSPRGPEDEEQAEQETDYVNFVALERNNGFLVLTAMVKDALLLRNGYIKCGWRKREDVVIENYTALSDVELAAVMQDEDIEVIGQSEYPAPQGMPMPGQPPMPPVMLYDVKVRRKQPTEYVETAPASPDEMLVSQRVVEPSLQNADFVQHRTRKTLSELREAGYKVDDGMSDDDDGSSTIEDMARMQFSTSGEMWEDPTMDPARRVVLFKESWLRIDRDGDGIAELRRVCSVGRTLLADEEAAFIPIACAVPTLWPHSHLGVSIYDQVKDLAQIKTALTRGMLDNLYLTNNQEKVVNMDMVDSLDDFLTSRPGGIKRVRGNPMEAVSALSTPFVGAGALQGLEYLDTVRESRTGFTRNAQGLDPESLRNATATAAAQAQSQATLRLEMIARTIAETGLRDLYRIIHALTLMHSTRAEKVKLRNKWVLVNPREWARRTELSISVGLGSNSGQQQVQNLMLVGQAQQAAAQVGLCGPEEFYNTAKRLVNAIGFKNPDDFFKAPAQQPKMGPNGQPVMGPDGKPVMEAVPPPSKPDPLVQAAQVKAQADGQTAMMKAQSDEKLAAVKAQADAQIAQVKAQASAQADAARAQADMAIQQHQVNTDAQLALAKEKMALELQNIQHSREQATAIQIANIKALAQVEAARIAASVSDGAQVEAQESAGA